MKGCRREFAIYAQTLQSARECTAFAIVSSTFLFAASARQAPTTHWVPLSKRRCCHIETPHQTLRWNLEPQSCKPQVESGAYALVVSTENITQNWYAGDNRSMLIPNTLFRMGASAVVLTNKRSRRRGAKYQLQNVYRVHLGADDTAFRWGGCAMGVPETLDPRRLSIVSRDEGCARCSCATGRHTSGL